MRKVPLSRQRMRDGTRLRRIFAGRRPNVTRTGEPAPGSTYEAVTRQMVRSLRDEVRDVKSRVNQLLTLIIAAILIEVLMRMLGI